ncbi:lysine methyltransferase 5Ab isoform 2-T2 [Pholidichthys leucotaenia]
MAKGKKEAVRVHKKPSEDAVESTVASQTETKENKPATSKVQTILQSLRSPNKPRSPLSDSSSILIQEGNDLDSANPDMLKLKKDLPNEVKAEICESKDQKPEISRHSSGVREQSTEQLVEKKPVSHTDSRCAANDKVSPAKPQRRAGCKPGTKKTENKTPQNRKVTDYYPIRRSDRKTKAELKNEQYRHLDNLIKNNTEEGMQVRQIEGKGRGVFALKGFKKGDFVVEYHGDLLDLSEAKIREAQYAEDPQTGCYMYYFQYQSKTYCVDATKETSRLGRLINHSKTGNCQTRLHPISGTPHLILVASRDIKVDEELLYDYGDRSKASILAHPWLKH